MIRSKQRRWFLVGLLGIPASLLDLEGPPPWNDTVALSPNDDTMSFLESELDMRWQVLNTSGYSFAAQGFETWLRQVVAFTRSASGTPWQKRACSLLSMSYQLQGTIARESMQFDLARQAFSKAYTAASEVNDLEMMAATRVRQGQIFRINPAQNDPLEAAKYFTHALDLIKEKSYPRLRGNALQALAEVYAQAQHPQDCWRNIGLAGHIIGREKRSNERSRIKFDDSTVVAWKGVCALYLKDYERATILIEKGLKDYNPLWISGRARFLMHEAWAFFGQKEIDMSITKAEEAIKLAGLVQNNRTLNQIKGLHQNLIHSRWKQESGVKRLGMLISTYEKVLF